MPLPPARRRLRRLASAALVPVVVAALGAVLSTTPVHADRPTVGAGQLRSQWDPNEPNLTPAAVRGGGFGRLYHVALDGEVFGSPVTAHGVVVVATERDRVYGIDETGGGVRWQVSAGAYGDDHGCNQVTPATEVGITSTPVIDTASDTVYVMARDWHGAADVAWRLHAYDLFSGSERPGWPVTVAGHAANSPGTAFDPYQHEQRPGLLLLGGTVVAGFGSFCDVGTYQGWIATVNTGNRALGLYDDVPGGVEGAFWESGSGFVADGPATFVATSGNPSGSGGSQAPMGPGTTVTAATQLSDAVVRFNLGSDGVTVTPVDYFSPARQDTNDADLGSSGFADLPDAMGISGHPHLGVVGGKFGTLYTLDRDHLGGRSTGDSGALGALTGTDSLFGQVAAWPGDGGYVYDAGTGHLNAFRLGQTGALTRAASASIAYGSGSPLVTSSGTSAGSATVWLYEHGSRQLRAYDAVPSGGSLTEIYGYTVGSTGDAHFNQVSADADRVLVATDNALDVFGTGGLPPVPCGCGGADGHDPHAPQGYWEVAADGGVFPWGNAVGYGSTGGTRLNAPIVALVPTADRRGYLLVASDGGVFPFGDARGYGSLGGTHLNQPVVGAAAAPGGGYWLVAADGGVFPFGPGAVGHGSTGDRQLNEPVVGMAATPDGGGYLLVARDGGVFPFGDAVGWGSTGGMRLNQPVVGMAGAPGGGYWLVAADGGVFPFGPGAGGHGSTGGMHLNQPVVGMAATVDGGGYLLVAADGGIFPFGDAVGYGSTGNVRLTRPMVGVAAS